MQSNQAKSQNTKAPPNLSNSLSEVTMGNNIPYAGLE